MYKKILPIGIIMKNLIQFLTFFDIFQFNGTTNLVQSNKCSKNSQKLLCIDLLLTKKRRSFLTSTELSYFHKITQVIMEKILKQVSNIVEYCDYKIFSNDAFIKEVEQNLSPVPDKSFQ